MEEQIQGDPFTTLWPVLESVASGAKQRGGIGKASEGRLPD